jgi:hypothetical protein
MEEQTMTSQSDRSDNQSNQEINEGEDNSGVRSTDVNTNPQRSLEEARNANEGKGSNASGSVAASTVEEHVPGTDSSEASDLPSAR